MAKKTETKTEKIEREYTIPLRREINKVASYQRAPKAMRAIKEFIVRHMKIRDRDVKKVRIDKYLNQEIWLRGIKKPLLKVRVKAIKEGDIVRVELADIPEKIKFQKIREERVDKKAEEKKPEKVESKEEEKKDVEGKKDAEEKEKEEEKKEEIKEKQESTIEAMEKIEKQSAKQQKHETSGKQKMPKHQFRKALQK